MSDREGSGEPKPADIDYWRPVSSAKAVTKPVRYITPAMAVQQRRTTMMTPKKNPRKHHPLGIVNPKGCWKPHRS